MSAEGDKNSRDLYAVLELAPDATLEDIRRAFRTIAARSHPDRHPGDAKVALRFKQINAAYQVLSDPERKFQYDQLTAPIEEFPLVPREANPAQEEAIREEPVRRRRSRRRRRSGRVGWALFITAVGIAAAAVLVPDLHRESAAERTAPAGTADDPGARIETTEAPLPPSESLPSPEARFIGRAPPRAASAADDLPVRTVTGDKWTFTIPADWQDDADAKGPRWSAPGGIGNYKPNVRLEISTFAGEPAKYFEDLDKKVPNGVEIVAEAWESDTTPDGLKREARVASGSMVLGRFIQYVVASRGHGYVLTCHGPPNAFDSVRPLCERILGSLRIK